jgi:hypothetical protein
VVVADLAGRQTGALREPDELRETEERERDVGRALGERIAAEVRGVEGDPPACTLAPGRTDSGGSDPTYARSD